jgi:cardiolipin synthase
MARKDHWFHSKSIAVDTLFSMIGSSNLDAHSAEINEELDVVAYDRDFSRKMEEIFTNDLERTRERTLEQFRHRSLWERAVEWIAYPFRSQL